MPDIPVNAPLSYVGVFLSLTGFFLLLTGLGILNVEKITVQKGTKTAVLGLFVFLIGLVFLTPDIVRTINQTPATKIPLATSEILETSTPNVITIVTTNATVKPPPTPVSVFASTPVSSVITTNSQKEIATVEYKKETPFFNNEISVSFDSYYSEQLITVSVRSLGYPRQTYSVGLSDRITYSAGAIYEILIADVKKDTSFFSNNSAIEIVVTRLDPSVQLTPTARMQLVIDIPENQETSIWNGELLITYDGRVFAGYSVSIRSEGYVRKSYTMSLGQSVTFEGLQKYTLTLADVQVAGGTTNIQLIVTK